MAGLGVVPALDLALEGLAPIGGRLREGRRGGKEEEYRVMREEWLRLQINYGFDFGHRLRVCTHTLQ